MIALVAAAGTVFAAAAPGTLHISRGERPPARLDLDPAVVIVLAALDDGPVGVDELPDGGWDTVTRLARAGLLHVGVLHRGRLALRATLTAASARYHRAPVDGAIRLSRFAVVRRHGDELVLDAPAAGARIILEDRCALTVVGELAGARTVAELVTAVPDCPAELVRDMVAVLVGVCAAGVADADGLLAEDHHPVLRQRELPDVLLHAASRDGLTDRPIGGSHPFTGVLAPVPAAAPAPDGPPVPLPRPELDVLRGTDPPLVAVMQARRSDATFGAEPVTVAQLGELLWRTAGVRSARTPTQAIPDELGGGPLPSGGGGASDLEIYLSVLRCTGLESGIWHYEPQAHALTAISKDRQAVEGMLAEAHRATGGSAPPVLLTLATRFDRVAREHRGIAYASTLKNVGACYATMQLAASAMGLRGYPLDTGNAALFAEVTGRDLIAESSVGEFLLGTLPGNSTDGQRPTWS